LKLLTKTINILEAKHGDFILSRNIDKNIDEFNIIKQTMRPIVPKENQLEIKLSDNTNIHTSTIHPTLVNRNNTWLYVDAKDLIVGDICQSLSDATTTIISIENTYIDENFADFSIDVVENYYAGKSSNKMMVVHNSATLYYPLWHLEVEDMLVLKNNKGVEDNRVRHMDYGVQFNKLMYERLLTGGDITLFSPSDVPGLYEAFFNDQDTFKELYEAAERKTKVRKKTVKAMDLFNSFLSERKDTGRIYLMNVDHANTHGSFVESLAPIRMSNLCVTGDTTVDISVNGEEMSVNIDELGSLMILHDDVMVRSYSQENDKQEYKKIEAFAKTHPEAEVLEITDTESGATIRCTPEHLVYTTNRGYVRAADLTEIDSLMIRK